MSIPVTLAHESGDETVITVYACLGVVVGFPVVRSVSRWYGGSNWRRLRMGKIEALLRDEILRLAKREMRQQVEPLRKENRELKKRVVALEKLAKPIHKEIVKKKDARLERMADLRATEEEVKAARITPEWVQNLRMKLNLSQSELAKIIGISVSGVRTWEYGSSSPTGSRREALVALRKLGRRDVKKLLKVQEESA